MKYGILGTGNVAQEIGTKLIQLGHEVKLGTRNPKNEKKYEHCSLCNICIPGSDHHCGIFEKCIGRKNLICFYLFPTFSIILLIAFIVSIFYNHNTLLYISYTVSD